MLKFGNWRLFLQAPIDFQTLMSHRSNLSVSWLLKYCSRHRSKGSKYFLSMRYAPTANRTAHTSFGFLSMTLQQKQLRKCKHRTPALHVIQKSQTKVDTHIWVVYSKVCGWEWTSKKRCITMRLDYLCAKNTLTILDLIGSANVITWRERQSTLWPLIHNFEICNL